MASVRIWALDDFCLKECQSKKGTKSSQSMSFSLPQYVKICDEKAERIIIDGFMHTIYHYACAGLCILFISRLSLHSTKASFSLVFFLTFFSLSISSRLFSFVPEQFEDNSYYQHMGKTF